MKTPAETVVFDQPAGRFILLNLKSRTPRRTDHRRVGRVHRPLAAIGRQEFRPAGEVSGRAEVSGAFRRGDRRAYAQQPVGQLPADASPEEDPAAVEQYHEFSDWYARLNALLGAGLAAAVRAVGGQCGPGPAKGHAVAGGSDACPRASPTGSRSPSAARIASSARWPRPISIGWPRPASSMASFKLVSFEQYRKLELR